MVREKKESRLSFRITPGVSDVIDVHVKNFNFIKDRSDFGTKSSRNYLEFLEVKFQILAAIENALISISKKVGAESIPEVEKLINLATEM